MKIINATKRVNFRETTAALTLLLLGCSVSITYIFPARATDFTGVGWSCDSDCQPAGNITQKCVSLPGRQTFGSGTNGNLNMIAGTGPCGGLLTGTVSVSDSGVFTYVCDQDNAQPCNTAAEDSCTAQTPE
jgi:hypothetical protein